MNKSIAHISTIAAILILATPSFAQNLSINLGGNIQPTKRDIEKSFLAQAFNGQSGACASAKFQAEKEARSLNARSLSTGSCNCDSLKKKLTGQQVGEYYTTTGKFYQGDEVEVFQCEVSARIIFDR